jgi:putative membrane-bound dehydrogenase-like protein
MPFISQKRCVRNCRPWILSLALFACVPFASASENLALLKHSTASSSADGHKPGAAIDGSEETDWVAASEKANEWWQIDLDESMKVRAVRIHWQKSEVAYAYQIESSEDGEHWSSVIDNSKNETPSQVNAHNFRARQARYLRVVSAKDGSPFGIREVEVLSKRIANPEGNGPIVATDADIKVPGAFTAKVFAAPPMISYPVCVAAAADGAVYVGVDEQASLGLKTGGGRVVKLVDKDGDGRADDATVFATMEHPRGLFVEGDSVWVLCPPLLMKYTDTNHDGVADKEETLVTGLSSEMVTKRGADHTTNGIRMGIDGWIYIAVGDFGFPKAKGADGRELTLRGGGIVRVLPDGTHLEVYCRGLRNVLDACIDPYMNMFTRDNTNDGGGWNSRVSHILQSAEYGYPSKFMNFADEIMPTLADYGGGSGTGGLFLSDPRWPKEFDNALYTSDWGRSEVYVHRLKQNGPTYDPHQEAFAKIPRPTDIDMDAAGRMFVSSWLNGMYSNSGPNVGFIALIEPKELNKDIKNQPRPNNNSDGGGKGIRSEIAVRRLYGQREMMNLERNAQTFKSLVDMAESSDGPIASRVAAIYGLKQLFGPQSHDELLKLVGDSPLRECALRALTDRADQLEGLSSKPFIAALKDDNPRVVAQAVISLGRLGRNADAKHLVPLLSRKTDMPEPTKLPRHSQPDPGGVIPHLAMMALVNMNAGAECVAALGGPHREGALRTLRMIHSPEVVTGVLDRLKLSNDAKDRQQILSLLIRLYQQEGEYTGKWWGTRPDTHGPYYDAVTWSESPRIAEALLAAEKSADSETAEFLVQQLARHEVHIRGLLEDRVKAAERGDEPQVAIAVPSVDKNDPSLIANRNYEDISKVATTGGDLTKGKLLFTKQSCIACHTTADGQTPKGPHLVDIGKRYKRSELIESVLRPSAKIAQGFDSVTFLCEDGSIVTGFVARESATEVHIRQANGMLIIIPQKEIEERKRQETSIMPEGLVNNLTPEQFADLLSYLESLH